LTGPAEVTLWGPHTILGVVRVMVDEVEGFLDCGIRGCRLVFRGTPVDTFFKTLHATFFFVWLNLACNLRLKLEVLDIHVSEYFYSEDDSKRLLD
jgi:hypothetical protein